MSTVSPDALAHREATRGDRVPSSEAELRSCRRHSTSSSQSRIHWRRWMSTCAKRFIARARARDRSSHLPRRARRRRLSPDHGQPARIEVPAIRREEPRPADDLLRVDRLDRHATARRSVRSQARRCPTARRRTCPPARPSRKRTSPSSKCTFTRAAGEVLELVPSEPGEERNITEHIFKPGLTIVSLIAVTSSVMSMSTGYHVMAPAADAPRDQASRQVPALCVIHCR